MTDRNDWQGRTGRTWADEWRRTDRSFAGLTDRLLARASARPIERALDVGCGAGEISLAIARGHPRSEVVGLDISESLVEVARERAANLGNVTFLVADAADWRASRFAPDLVVSRHGVMFFPDPVAAFTNLAQGSAPSARLVFSCFRDRTENPWAGDLVAMLPEPSRPADVAGAPGPFAFADRDRVEIILTQAGWMEIAFEPVDFAYVAGTGDRAVEDALSYFQAIGPAAAIVKSLPEDERHAFQARLTRYLEGHAQGPLVALPGAAWIVSARTR